MTQPRPASTRKPAPRPDPLRSPSNGIGTVVLICAVYLSAFLKMLSLVSAGAHGAAPASASSHRAAFKR
ncbi:MAG: hypothetical protein HYY79_02815 [Betaproteobacteria bacterium]|nr:hypothetical protein [Betaproteobacteria bacterium]